MPKLPITISLLNFYIIFNIVNYFTFVNQSFAQSTNFKTSAIAGNWRANLKTDAGELPFFIEIFPTNSNNIKVWVVNGKEKLQMDKSFILNDSLHIPMKLFDSEIITKVSGTNMSGIYKKQKSDKTYLTTSFAAQKALKERFIVKNKVPKYNISGRYKVVFASPNTPLPEIDPSSKVHNYIGEFKQTNSKVSGTILSPTGDYRFLEGIMDGDSLKLSTFDGSHIYLFLGKYSNNTITGTFISNVNQIKNWQAVLAPEAILPEATALTYLKPGTDKLSFNFPNSLGQTYNFPNTNLAGMVKIIQIMGSWCPNCMDETMYLSPWYNANKNRGVEIIGLSFEKTSVLAEAAPKMDWMQKRFKMNYPILFAGANDKANMIAALPALNAVVGFPTTIFIDKNDKVRHIHTGFSGPATGVYYTNWVKEFNQMVDSLVNEK